MKVRASQVPVGTKVKAILAEPSFPPDRVKPGEQGVVGDERTFRLFCTDDGTETYIPVSALVEVIEGIKVVLSKHGPYVGVFRLIEDLVLPRNDSRSLPKGTILITANIGCIGGGCVRMFYNEEEIWVPYGTTLEHITL